MKFTTPPQIPNCISEITKKIGGNLGTPEFVSVSPAPGCQINNCFINAKKEADMTGGTVVYGWLIWSNPEIKAHEAIFHAVVRTKKGTLEDVTPQIDGERSVLFIPDNVRSWSGTTTSRVRHLEVSTEIGAIWLKVGKAIDSFLTSRPHYHGHPMFTENEARVAAKKLGRDSRYFLAELGASCVAEN